MTGLAGALALRGQAALAQTAAAGAGGAGSFMRSELGLLLQGAGWLVAVAGGLAVLALGYILLQRGVRRSFAGGAGRFSAETITAIGWIGVPLVILATIMVPAAELLYHSDEEPYVTVSVTAHEWYWQYDYVSVPGVGFDSHVIPDSQLQPGQAPGGAVDHPLVLPVGKKIRFIVSSGDVLHGFFVPPLGVEIYAVPGALLTGWTIIKKPGSYFGHSSSICGNNHPPMPIEIKAVPLKAFLAWSRRRSDAAEAGTPPAPDGAGAPPNGASAPD
ncbi:cytochrome c oxidase subunit II [Acidocella sp.]|uniref:cytochrome c oxidase subunit II n=1 Tax=Acidocella sp. TaxID=50710 RepID=UPI003D01A357